MKSMVLKSMLLSVFEEYTTILSDMSIVVLLSIVVLKSMLLSIATYSSLPQATYSSVAE